MRIQPSAMVDRLPTQFFATLVAKVNKAIAAGHDIINLGQGNPDLPTPPHIVEELSLQAARPVHHKYPPFSGRLELKQAVAHWYKEEFDVDLDPEEEVAILFGSKTGLVEICQVLMNPGDVALVPDPGYPDYWSGVAVVDGRMVMMPLRAENAFLPDYGQLKAEDLEKAKLMFLNYPNNPTAVNAPVEFYEETIRFAKRHEIVVCHDFAYGAISFDGKKPVSFLQVPGAKEVGVEFYTLSKTYNMAGWRVGAMVGNKELVRLINLIQDHYFVSLFGAVQMAAAKAMTGSQQCVRDLVQVYQSRRDVLFTEMHRIGWQANPSEGSFFAWLPVPQGYSSVEFSDLLLEKAHVVVAPGVGFGPTGEGYVRAALLSTEERLAEAVRRIEKLGLFAGEK
ncbi:pyridoxal phosphate-dependent aminotransferase [Brevibacillus composti]|uniref:Pyridoxal phosphate-dependent aminotransferase n=1 Tax=Brevibacillus composti TaxID=2796470 RepID=A0A7T5JPW9_9BACL|nr:pyridoxal phosphate-dependent aminotransferase [Brevibacillus composti]QQE75540.1 pyridoxal phosphate-dependent aminotransferase [Brevibacillus composti]QUO42566.1 pyridoxal phosphate-dependent aminotransferase [Brevibacillus composti]